MKAHSTILSLQQDLVKIQISPTQFIQKAHANSIESLAVHPNQKVFATGSHDNTIKLWDANAFKETMTLSDHKQGVWALDYSQDGNMLASGGPDKSVLIWDSKKSSPGIKINGHKDKIYCTRFNESSKLLGTCGEQGQIFIWDLAKTKEPLKKIQINTLVVYDLRWSQNEELLFASTLSSYLLAFQTKKFSQVSQDIVIPNQQDSKCQSVAANFKIINRRIFCGTSHGTIAWYEYNNKLTKQTQFQAHLDSVRTVNYHPTRKILLSSGRDGSVRLWNAESETHHPKILGNLALHIQNVPAISFLDNERVVTGSWDQKLAIWNVKTLIN